MAAIAEVSLYVGDWLIDGESRKCLLLRRGKEVKPLAVFLSRAAVDDYAELWARFAESVKKNSIVPMRVD